MTVRVAIVCPNFVGGCYGGVETVASWLRGAVNSQSGFSAEIISIATSRSDASSTRLAALSTWGRRPSSSWHDVFGTPVEHFGSWVAELEPARYLPRSTLTERLSTFDVVQVVSGTPAFGLVAWSCARPVCLQVATTVASERRYDVAPGRSVTARLGGGARAVSTALVGRLERQALCRADHTFVENSWMLEHAQSVAGAAAVTLAPPGVDDRRFVPGSANSEGAYLLTVGRLGSDRKNLAGLVRSYAVARSSFNLELPLVIAGGGILLSSVRSLIGDLALGDHVRVVQDPPSDELVRLYQGARLFVHTSHEEGLGLVYLEAQSCGVPVVTSSNAGAAEVFRRGAVGQLVAPFEGASEALACAMSDWAIRGAERAHRLGARRFATTQFGTEVSVARFIDRYRELLR